MNVSFNLLRFLERTAPAYQYFASVYGAHGIGICSSMFDDRFYITNCGVVIVSKTRKQVVDLLKFKGFDSLKIERWMLSFSIGVWRVKVGEHTSILRIYNYLHLQEIFPRLFDAHPFGWCTADAVHVFNGSAFTLAHELIHYLGYPLTGNPVSEKVVEDLTPNFRWQTPLGSQFVSLVEAIFNNDDSAVELDLSILQKES